MNRQRIQQALDHARTAARRLSAGDVQGALRAGADAVQECPDLPAPRIALARAQLAANQAQAALATLNVLHLYGHGHTAAHSNPRWLDLHARTLARLGRLVEARQALHSLHKLRPAHRPTLLRLAGLMIETQQPALAAELLTQYLGKHSRDHAAIRLLAQAHEQAGDCESAMRCHDRLPAAIPARHADQLLAQARLARKARRLGQSLDLYRAALKTLDDDAAIHLEAAELAESIGDDAAAIGWLALAARIDSSLIDVPRRLAMLHMRSGRFAQAVPAWRAVRRLDADDTECLAGMSVCAQCLNRPAFARRLERRLERVMEPADRRKLMGRCWSLATTGRIAADLIRPQHEESGRDPLTILLADADALFTRRLQANPSHADLHYHQGVCRMELGRSDSAAESLDAALRLNPGYVAAARRRLQLLREENNPAAAAALIANFQRVKPGNGELDDPPAKAA